MARTAYDLVPYSNHSFVFTHPDRMHTIARLFQHPAPPVERARVLELGCGRGGNILPMASTMPDARFVGVDLSARQIEEARETARVTDLRNVYFVRRSITELDDSIGEFDYIICHGVYSWVNEEVRSRILAVCRDRLTRHGVAFLSYNTLPGWNTVRTIRDLMMFHVRAVDEPAQRIAQAREAVPFVLAALEGHASPYVETLRTELQKLEKADDAYLFHEYLAEVNEPMYFTEFAAAARGAGLDYLADTDIATMYLGNLPAQTSARLREQGDLIASEQYMDFIRNRRFRCSVLVHAGAPYTRVLRPGDVERFYLSTALRLTKPMPADGLRSEAPLEFGNGDGTFEVNGLLSKAAMLVLCETPQRPVAYEDLVAGVAARAGVADLQAVRQHLNEVLNLLGMVLHRTVRLHGAPARYLREVSPRPRVPSHARHQADTGVLVTNGRHDQLDPDPLPRVVMTLADGTRDHAALCEGVAQAFREGALRIAPNNAPDAEFQPPPEIVAELTHATLEWLAANALLMA